MSSYIIYTDQLKGEYKSFFDAVETYGVLHCVDQLELEESLSNLLDMLLIVQENNEPISSICEEDIDLFCKNYFNHPNALKNRIIAFPKVFYYLSISLFCFGLIDLFCVEHISELMTVKTSISPVIIGAFIGIMISIFIQLSIDKLDKKHKFKTIHIASIDIILTLICITLYILYSDSSKMMNAMLVEFITLSYIVIYKCIVFYKRYKNHGNIFKSDYEKSISLRAVFKDTLNEQQNNKSLEEEFLKHQLKTFNKKQKLTQITEQEYDKKLDKEIYWMDLENKYMWIIFLILISIVLTFNYKESGFIDTVILGIILCIVEAGIYKTFLSIMKSAVEMRKKISELTKKKGITTIQYAKEVLNVDE